MRNFFRWLFHKPTQEEISAYQNELLDQQDYKLSKNSANYYITEFEKSSFKVTLRNQPDERLRRWRDSSKKYDAYLEVGPSDDYLNFFVSLELDQPTIPDNLLERTKIIISQVIEMDHEARIIDLTARENEQLFGIHISEEETRFEYVSTKVNTEWHVVFKFNDNNQWTCIGIPDHRRPGHYIR